MQVINSLQPSSFPDNSAFRRTRSGDTDISVMVRPDFSLFGVCRCSGKNIPSSNLHNKVDCAIGGCFCAVGNHGTVVIYFNGDHLGRTVPFLYRYFHNALDYR